MSQVINFCRFRPICLRLLLFVFGLAGSVSGSADTIAIIGTGDVAQALVSGIGLEPIDLGPLRHARYVEGMLILWINNRYAGGEPFDYYLRKVGKD
jgi:hypothetical protein